MARRGPSTIAVVLPPCGHHRRRRVALGCSPRPRRTGVHGGAAILAVGLPRSQPRDHGDPGLRHRRRVPTGTPTGGTAMDRAGGPDTRPGAHRRPTSLGRFLQPHLDRHPPYRLRRTGHHRHNRSHRVRGAGHLHDHGAADDYHFDHGTHTDRRATTGSAQRPIARQRVPPPRRPHRWTLPQHLAGRWRCRTGTGWFAHRHDDRRHPRPRTGQGVPVRDLP